MLSRLVEAAVALEGRMQASPTHKMHAAYVIGAGYGDPTIANFFFRNRSHMEKARRLEMAHAAGLISMEDFCSEFPEVHFVAVNAHYTASGFPLADTFISEGVSLVRPNLEILLTEISIELCKGAKVSYVPDDNKILSDVVVAVTIARSGTVSGVYKTDYPPPFSFRLGTSALDVFEAMEKHIRRS